MKYFYNKNKILEEFSHKKKENNLQKELKDSQEAKKYVTKNLLDLFRILSLQNKESRKI